MDKKQVSLLKDCHRSSMKVPSHFRTGHKAMLVHAMYQGVNSNWYDGTIVNTTLVKRHKFCGFDAKSLHKLVIDFSNEQAWRKFKNLWYTYEKVAKNTSVHCLHSRSTQKRTV